MNLAVRTTLYPSAEAFRRQEDGVSACFWAESVEEVESQLQRDLIDYGDISIDWAKTVLTNAMGYSLFSGSDEVQFYRFLAIKTRNGARVEDSISDLADSVDSEFLKGQLFIMRSAMRRSTGLGDAMQLIGIPEKDCCFVSSSEAAGRVYDALSELSATSRRNSMFRREVNRIVRMPKRLVYVAIIAIFLGPYLTGPQILNFINKQGGPRGRFVDSGQYHWKIIHFGQFVQDNLLAVILSVIGLCIGWYLFSNSQQLIKLISKIKTVRIFVERTDQLTIWNAFGMLKSVGESTERCVRLCRDLTRDELMLQNLDQIGARAIKGYGGAEIIKDLVFPKFIHRLIVGAFKNEDSLGETLLEIVREQQEFLDEEFDKIRALATSVKMAVLVIILFIIGGVSYAPFVSLSSSVI